MKMNRGKVKYVPKRFLDALFMVRQNYQYDCDRDAFNKMAEFAPVGIEIENAIRATGLIIKRKKK